MIITKFDGELLIERFLQKLMIMGRSSETGRIYGIELRRMFKYFAKHESVKTLDHFDRVVIERYQISLKRGRKKLSENGYYNNALVLRLFCRWLEDEGLVQRLAKYVHVPKRPEKRIPEFFSEQEVKKMLDIVETKSKLGARDKALLELLYSIGIRSGEIGNITLNDVKFEERMIIVRKSKGKKYDVLPIGDIALKHLKHYLRKKRHLFVNADKVPWFFLNLTGTQMEGRNVTGVVKKYAKQAGIERRAYAHMLRHSMATHMIRRHAPIRHVQELLGHKRLDTTMLYTHLSPEDLREVHTKFHPRNQWSRTSKNSKPVLLR